MKYTSKKGEREEEKGIQQWKMLIRYDDDDNHNKKKKNRLTDR